MSKLSLTGLVKRPELNGKTLHVIGEDKQSGRWVVEVDGHEKIKVRLSSLTICESTSTENARSRKVTLRGLAKRADLNGQEASCDAFEAQAGRWNIRLGDVSTDALLVKPENVLDLNSGAPLQPAFCIADAEGKGKGLFASDHLQPGHMIFTEAPILSWTNGMDRGNLIAQCANIARAFLNLSRVSQGMVLELCQSEKVLGHVSSIAQTVFNDSYMAADRQLLEFGEKQVLGGIVSQGVSIPRGEETRVWRAIRATLNNAFAESGDRVDFSGLYLTLSRANHSCAPNALRSDRNNGKGSRKDLIAIMPIKPGDEITISYLTEEMLTESFAQRNGHLRSWGIACGCCACQSQFERTRCFKCPSGCQAYILASKDNDCFSQCSICQATLDSPTKDDFLQAESQAITMWQKIEGNPTLMAAYPKMLPTALDVAMKKGLGPMHWVIAKLNNLSTDFLRQTYTNFGDDGGAMIPKAIRHLSDELGLFNYCVKDGISRQRAWLKESKADMLCLIGKVQEALPLYLEAMDELKCALALDNEYVADIRKKVGNVLQGRASRNLDDFKLM